MLMTTHSQFGHASRHREGRRKVDKIVRGLSKSEGPCEHKNAALATTGTNQAMTNGLAELSWVMLGLRASVNLDTCVSPSVLVTGQQPALPGQLIINRAIIDDISAFGRELA